MPEQFHLDFGAEKAPESKTEEEPALETLGYDELKELYQKNVGVNPEYRNLNRGELISGIQDPEAERARLAEEDKASDKDDLASPYGKK